MSHVIDLFHYNISIFTLIGLKLQTFNPTPVRGCFLPPYRKMAITPKIYDPKEPKLCDFSLISLTNPPMHFLETHSPYSS